MNTTAKPIELPFNDFMASDKEMLEFYRQHPLTFANPYGDYYASANECIEATFKYYAEDYKGLSVYDVKVNVIFGAVETYRMFSCNSGALPINEGFESQITIPNPTGWVEVSNITESMRSVWRDMGCGFVGRCANYSSSIDVSWDVHAEYPDGLWRSYAGGRYGTQLQPEYIFVLPPLKTT